jgi:hypothetical protein
MNHWKGAWKPEESFSSRNNGKHHVHLKEKSSEFRETPITPWNQPEAVPEHSIPAGYYNTIPLALNETGTAIQAGNGGKTERAEPVSGHSVHRRGKYGIPVDMEIGPCPDAGVRTQKSAEIAATSRKKRHEIWNFPAIHS